MPGESYRRRLRSLLLYLRYVFWALINSSLCWFCTRALGLILFQIFFTAPFAYPDRSVWNVYLRVRLAWGLIILLHAAISALFTSSPVFLEIFSVIFFSSLIQVVFPTDPSLILFIIILFIIMLVLFVLSCGSTHCFFKQIFLRVFIVTLVSSSCFVALW